MKRSNYSIQPNAYLPNKIQSSFKMKSNNKYSIDPFDFKLRKQEEYTLINEDTKDKIKMTIY